MKRPIFRDREGAPAYVVVRGRPLRQLTAEEVSFELTTEPDESAVEGHFATGDAAADAALEQGILDRLEAGDDAAWCCVVVKATWISSGDNTAYEASDAVGACSLDDEYSAATCAREHALRENALASLNEQLAAAVERAETLAWELRPGRRKL